MDERLAPVGDVRHGGVAVGGPVVRVVRAAGVPEGVLAGHGRPVVAVDGGAVHVDARSGPGQGLHGVQKGLRPAGALCDGVSLPVEPQGGPAAESADGGHEVAGLGCRVARTGEVVEAQALRGTQRCLRLGDHVRVHVVVVLGRLDDHEVGPDRANVQAALVAGDVDPVSVLRCRRRWRRTCHSGGGRLDLTALLRGEGRPLGQELLVAEAVARGPPAGPSVRVRRVAHGPGLLARGVAGVAVDRAVLSDPRLRDERVPAVLDGDHDVADAALVRGGEDHVTDAEAPGRGEVGVVPLDLAESSQLHAAAHVAGPVVVDLKEGLVAPRHLVGVVEAVADRPAHEAGAVRVLWRGHVPRPVRVRVPGPPLGLAVADVLAVADAAGDGGGD